MRQFPGKPETAKQFLRNCHEPLTMERGGNTYYYHRDALGSITEVTDGAGALVERYEYDVYGAVTIFDASDVEIAASAIGNPYLFTARRYDPESGNYYYRARMYSPRLGRFLSQDPLGFDAGDYNLYRYAFNSPVNYYDPSGLQSDDPDEQAWIWLEEHRDSPIPWDQLSPDERRMLSEAGWDPVTYDAEWITGNAIDISMTWEDPAVWIAVLVGGGRLLPAVGRGLTCLGTRCLMNPVCAALVFGVGTGGGGDSRIDELVVEAQRRYPRLAGQIHQHHIEPIYLGGDPQGATVAIDAAYHQMITNAFRALWPYGQPPPSAEQLQEIMRQVYEQFPLP